ncbi:vesicle associated membrane protein 2 [Phyllostomus discolor]|uniref:Vesicle associated membrane protein 2 n=1 Tax=Phyllostomus discolor TaxID=89673 RepID=A0A833ZKI2_9CHIR|nr:vesicle associated membrane protein 2 [Phyllostomus discolor]
MCVLGMLVWQHQGTCYMWAHGGLGVPSLRWALAHPLPCGLLLQVVDIMRVNVDKVLERDQKLSELDDRADALQAGASQFETSAAKLKRKYWWKNLKMMIILGVICAIILIIIIVYFSS